MALAWVVFLSMVVFSLYDIKKAVIVWMPLRLLFNPQVAIRYAPPAMSLDIAVSFWLVFLYYIKCHDKEKKMGMTTEDSWIVPIFGVYLFSYFISFPFSPKITTSVFTKIIKLFVMYFGFTFVFYRALKTSQDLTLFTKTTLAIIMLITALGIYQAVMKDNPFLDYVYMNSPHNETTEGRMFYTPPWMVDEFRLRYGMIRSCSFFAFHVPFGTACVMLTFFVGFLLKNFFCRQWTTYLRVALILLCVGIIVSNSKQAYIGVVVLLFCFFRTKEIFSYRIFLLVSIIGALWLYFPNIFNNYISLFDSDLAEEGGGSTIALREAQYKVAFEMFSLNPIFGNGPFSLSTLRYMSMEYSAILGAESIFLKILPERGIIGVIAYIYMYYVLYSKLRIVMPIRQIQFFLVCYFVMEVAGGQKDMTLFFGILIATSRLMRLKRMGFLKKGINN